MKREVVSDHKVLESLNALSLFSSQRIIITNISEGLSNDCYLVSLTNAKAPTTAQNSTDTSDSVVINESFASSKVTRYFSKRLIINSNESNGESVEAEAVGYASSLNITPRIAYLDKEWLVQPYIKGTNLATLDVSTKEKISYVLALLVQCHGITPIRLDEDPDSEMPPLLETRSEKSRLPILDETSLRNMLLVELASLEEIPEFALDHHSKQQSTVRLAQKMLAQVAQWLASFEKTQNNPTKSLVLCHGDANFSNVLISEVGNYLVDFECASWSDREYDLAMFIAINDLPSAQLPHIITEYERLSGTVIKGCKVFSYLPYCLALNALWFIKKTFENPAKTSLLEKAQRQIEQLKLANNHKN